MKNEIKMPSGKVLTVKTDLKYQQEVNRRLAWEGLSGRDVAVSINGSPSAQFEWVGFSK